MLNITHRFELFTMRITVCCCLISLLLYSFPAHSENSGKNQDSGWLFQELSFIKQQITNYEESENQARQALNLAENALYSAMKNSEAEAISKQAVSIAKEAIATAQRLKASNQIRQNALEEAARWELSSKEYGVAGIVTGQVLKKSQRGSSIFDGKSPLQEGDAIETGSYGRTEIMLPDHSIVSTGSDTVFEILKLDAKELLSDYKIVKGKLHVARACMKYALEYRRLCWVTHYRIPKVAIAVRGTEFSIEINNDTTSVTVFEGEIEIGEKGTNRPVKVGEMERLLIDSDGAVRGPLPVSKDSIHRWWETVN